MPGRIDCHDSAGNMTATWRVISLIAFEGGMRDKRFSSEGCRLSFEVSTECACRVKKSTKSAIPGRSTRSAVVVMR